MKYSRWTAILFLQVVLLMVELGTQYDSAGRQIALSITNIGATIGLFWFDRWLRQRGQHLSWITIVFVLGSVWIDALGNFQHMYARFWWYDRVTHAIGGMAVTALFIDVYQSWRRSGKLSISPRFATWSGFLLGQFVAAMYEVTEWLGDWWFATERVRSAFDAPRDLFFNLLGGLLVVALFRLRKAKK